MYVCTRSDSISGKVWILDMMDGGWWKANEICIYDGNGYGSLSNSYAWHGGGVKCMHDGVFGSVWLGFVGAI